MGKKPSSALRRAAQLEGGDLFYCKFLGTKAIPSENVTASTCQTMIQQVTDELHKKKGWKPPPVELRTTFGEVKVIDRKTNVVYLDIPHREVRYRHASWVKGKGSTTFAMVAGPHGRQAGTKCYVLKYEGGKVAEVIQHLSQKSTAFSGGGGGGSGGGAAAAFSASSGPATFRSEDAQLEAALAASRADQQQQAGQFSPQGSGNGAGGAAVRGGSAAAMGAATSQQEEEMMLQQALAASMGDAGPAVAGSQNQNASHAARWQTTPTSDAQLKLREEQAMQQALQASMRDAFPTQTSPRATPALKGDDLLDLFGVARSPPPASAARGALASPQEAAAAAAAAFTPTPPSGNRQSPHGRAAAAWTPPVHSYDATPYSQPPSSASTTPAAPSTATSSSINFGAHQNQMPVYKGLWSRAVPANTTRLGPNEAFALLGSSGLDNDTLSTIWTLSDTEQPAGSLSQPEFYVALKLIAMKQTGLEPRLARLSLETEIPQLQVHTNEVKAQLQSQQPHAPSQNYQPAAAAANNRGSLLGRPRKGSGRILPTIPVAAAAPAAAAFATTPAPTAIVSGTHQPRVQQQQQQGAAVSEAAILKHLWNNASQNDFLMPNDAVTFFSTSGLGYAELGLIWSLADTEEPLGRLCAAEFEIALKLISQKQNGIPPSLPGMGTECALPYLKGHTERAVADATAEAQATATARAAAEAQLAGEAVRAAEAQRAAVERQQQEQARRIAEAQRLAELQRAEEARQLAQAQRMAEMQRVEEARLLAEAHRAAELQRAAAEAQRAAEAVQVAEMQRAQGEAQRAAAAHQEHQAAARRAAAADAAQWHGGIAGMAEFIMGSVAVDERGLADGGSLRDYMLRSGLPNATLAELWGRADSQELGKLNQQQIMVLLGLLSLAQAGASPDVAAVNANTPPPVLQGVRPPPAPTPAPAPSPPAVAGGWKGGLSGMADYVFQLAAPDAAGLMSGKTLRHLLLMSKLPQDLLAVIWELADTRQVGSLDRAQVEVLLGLLSLAQNGGASTPDPNDVGPGTSPPVLEGLEPPS